MSDSTAMDADEWFMWGLFKNTIDPIQGLAIHHAHFLYQVPGERIHHEEFCLPGFFDQRIPFSAILVRLSTWVM